MRIDRARLEASIEELGRIGATERGGLTRVALTDEDKRGRDLLVRWMREAGLRMSVDQMGNIFGIRAATESLPPVFMGSDADSVPTGGKYDGQLGVLCALETIRTLIDARARTRHPVGMIVFTNEEGARFQPAMIASGVMAGKIPLEDAYNARDRDGLRLVDELERIGYDGPEQVGGRDVFAFFETHIEQGPILEAEKKTIGVVQGAQGQRWFEVTMVGQEAHAGPTPMKVRKDALVGAAHVVSAVNRIGHENQPFACATVGLINSSPNSRNTIPGKVFFTIDLRHPEDAVLSKMAAAAKAASEEAAARNGLQLDFKEIWYSPPVKFDTNCVSAVKAGAEELGYASMPIISGAGHDACYMSRVAPTGMVFIPCEDGISHNEIENATREDCGAGCDVLLRAMVERANAN